MAAAKKAKKAAKKTAAARAPKKAKKASKQAAVKADGTCFVLMPFSSLFRLYYDSIIDAAVRDAKLEPKLASDLFRPSAIVGDIWTMIQEAKVLLAVLTSRNANVFYELGLAHAIGKPVVLISETIDDVPFDLQSYRVILYDKDQPNWGTTLRDGITNAITETLAHPASTVPSTFAKTVPSQAPEVDEITARLDRLEHEFRAEQRQTSRVSEPGPIALPATFISTTSHRLLNYTENEDPSPPEIAGWLLDAYPDSLDTHQLLSILGPSGHTLNTAKKVIAEYRKMRPLG